MIIGICDDEKICIDRTLECLEQAKKELGVEFKYITFSSGEELLKSKEHIDILFLDVEMDGISGIDTMKQLEEKDNVTYIIFASSHSEYVFDSFGFKTMGFICKPIVYEKFLKEIKKLIEKMSNTEPIQVNVDGRDILISPDDIMYVSGERNYVKVVTRQSEYLTYGNMKAWEEKLVNSSVIRVHKSYLVNLKYITKISDVASFVNTADEIPVGRKYKEEARGKYKDYLLKTFREKTHDR
jgi:DNA-binding LytR/AlgR family response regulator